MNHWDYVTAGYVITFATLGLYALRTLVRGRRLARRLPPEQRRWM
ncbi:hypothetical protein BH20ACT2_BH20ACT2_20040 [soil metagenome]